MNDMSKCLIKENFLSWIQEKKYFKNTSKKPAKQDEWNNNLEMQTQTSND